MRKNSLAFRQATRSLLLSIALLLLVAGCADRQEETLVATSTTAATAEMGGAPPATATVPGGYPRTEIIVTATEPGSSYPPPPPPTLTPMVAYPAETATPTGKVLALDRPAAGDTTIRGTGPAGLEITIMNITLMEELATVTVDNQGNFQAEVSPLPSGVRIGLTADVEASEVTETVLPADGAINIPQVGYFYDSYVIPSTP